MPSTSSTEQQRIRAAAARLEKLLVSLEKQLMAGKLPTKRQENSLWENIKRITSDLWQAGKTVAADFGKTLPDLLPLLGLAI